ncbi:MAG TPA: ABC transporter permease, partial [Segetibacter sp.]|nr:ABC transporter permease [Segetibacter sp.]
MLQHNLMLFFRNAKRYKGAFFINLIGLSTGLACTLLIYMWVHDELSVDKFHEKDKRLFQVMQNLKNGEGDIQTIEQTPGILPQALAAEIPEIEYATSVVPASMFKKKGIVSVANKQIKAGGQFIGKDYFNTFSCTFINGDKKDIQRDKYNIAISDELANTLFGSVDNVIGKTIEWNYGQFNGTYKITGIFKKLPKNTTDPFDLLLNYELFLEKRPWMQDWGNSDPSTFIVLKEGTDIQQVNRKIKNFLHSKNKDLANTLFAQRYSDRYLYGTYENGVVAGGRISYVRLFTLIAVFILLIACINFMNLSTAKALRRIKEVGIKKAIGAGRGALIFQFLAESLLMTLISLAVAIVLIGLFLPAFNSITGKDLTFSFTLPVSVAALVISFITAIISGSYPAFHLSGFKPAVVLKGKVKGSVSELLARKGLVVFQFAVSAIFIIAVVVIYKQVAYVQTKSLGYNRENVLQFEMDINNENDKEFFAEGGQMEQKIGAFVNEVKTIPGVISVANFEHDVTGRHGTFTGVDWKDGKDDEQMDFSNLQNGYDFIETLGIQLADGRSFSRGLSNERLKVILNEEAVKKMGLTNPIGKTIKVQGKEKQIIGIAKNFNFESLYAAVKPCIIQLEGRGTRIMVKMKSGSEKQIIGQLAKLYQKHNQGLPFEYTFLDDNYQALYESEQRVAQLSKYFGGLAILISCLGLFGLAAFTSERRFKEIGVRKVLGATVSQIVLLLSKDFIMLV